MKIRIGLNLTYRSLASILKYDKVIPKTKNERIESLMVAKKSGISPYKGFYLEEADLVNTVRKNLLFSNVYLTWEALVEVETLKLFNYYTQINSPKLKIVEFRGHEIVKYIFRALSTKSGHKLLPEDYQELFDRSHKENRKRIICDYISGMTDNFCLEFYGRLTSEHPKTIFKPVS